MVHRLHRRMTHLLTLSPTRRRLCLRLLAVMLLETDIHVLLNIGHMRQNVANNAHLNCPSEEIELTHRRLLNRRLTANLETDPLSSAKGIKEPLGIRLEFALIVEMHHELFVCSCFIGYRITHVELLGIIGDEPVNEAETYWR